MLARTNLEILVLMGMARAAALKSPDPYKKVGCIGLDMNGNILGHGINHGGFSVKDGFWDDREKRRPFVVHAEMDLVTSIKPKTLFAVLITLFPCVHCMNLLASAGTRMVYYDEMYDKDRQAIEVARHHQIFLVDIKRDVER